MAFPVEWQIPSYGTIRIFVGHIKRPEQTNLIISRLSWTSAKFVFLAYGGGV